MLFRSNVEEKNAYLRAMLGEDVLDYEAMASELIEYANVLAPYCCDTSLYLYKELQAGRKVLFEGAQGVMLDVDLGTYPYVTSSNTGAGSVTNGAGVPPSLVRRVIGISKAYTTRVGSGPFPTELEDEIGDRLRREGGEFGATTGRARRCGWFDAVALRYALAVGGMNYLAVTNLDVLSGFDEIKICVAYERDGNQIGRAHV